MQPYEQDGVLLSNRGSDYGALHPPCRKNREKLVALYKFLDMVYNARYETLTASLIFICWVPSRTCGEGYSLIQ